MFVDVEGNLRKLSTDALDPIPLYNEFFSELIGGEIVVTFNPYQKDYYITDGEVGYCLTSIGLAEIAKAPTALVNNAGSLIGFYTGHGIVTGKQYPTSPSVI